jgi:hypothetical protein
MADRVKVIVHDTRLEGDAPWHLVNATCVVNKTHSIKSILSWINVKATKYGYIDDLYVLAHGRVNEKTNHGGYGVALGKDEIKLCNVDRWVDVNGSIGHIYLLACAAADTDYETVGIGAATGDGLTLCSKLARYSGALVTASDAIQYYYRGMWGIFGDTIDFGDWEGTVYTWDPGGSCVDVGFGS